MILPAKTKVSMPNLTKACDLGRQKNYKTKKRVNLAKLNRLLLILFGILLAFFVFVSNDISIKGMIEQNLRNEYSKIQTENDKIELQVMQLQSYDAIDAKAKAMQMVKVDKIDYINLDQAMAKK